MGPPPKPTLISVDTNVLIDLADENETVIKCIETVKASVKNPRVLIVPTVLQELADIAETPSRPASPLALKVLTSLIRKYDFAPINCVPVGHGIVEITASKIRNQGLLPREEVNDSFIIAESAIANCALLITSDHHLHGIDHAQLNALLTECDLPCPILVSPFKIVKRFRVRAK